MRKKAYLSAESVPAWGRIVDSIPSNGQVKKATSCCRMKLRQEVICMARKYTKVEQLAGIIRERKTAGETNRAIAESYGLTLKQIKDLLNRQNRKERLLAAGYIPQPKGRPRKGEQSPEVRTNNEIVKLRMQVELLRNFLLEVGRR
jgi:predicted transcriptional regulator